MNNIDKYSTKLIDCRRTFHMYPEPGWCEFRTTYIIYNKLKELGYEVKYGRDIIKENSRYGVPDCKTLQHFAEKALVNGVDPTFLSEIKDGFTGLIAELHISEGPAAAFRFDIDCVKIKEADDESHRPRQLGFASVNEGYAHSCGHDGHIAIGLEFAEIIVKNKHLLKGKIILIFQPAEEGVRGAKAIIDKGVLPKIDYMFGGHIGLSTENINSFSAGGTGFLASKKFDVILKGRASHAANSPEKGINALLAANSIISGFYNIPRNSQGLTMINVGVINAGSFRSAIPENAELQAEVRGENNELSSYMYEKAVDIVHNISKAYGCQYKIIEAGSSLSEDCSPELVDMVYDMAEKLGIYHNIYKSKQINGSEDFTYFMKHVKDAGGQAAYMLWGADIKGSFHSSDFDFSEESMVKALKVLCELLKNIFMGG